MKKYISHSAIGLVQISKRTYSAVNWWRNFSFVMSGFWATAVLSEKLANLGVTEGQMFSCIALKIHLYLHLKQLRHNCHAPLTMFWSFQRTYVTFEKFGIHSKIEMSFRDKKTLKSFSKKIPKHSIVVKNSFLLFQAYLYTTNRHLLLLPPKKYIFWAINYVSRKDI